MKIGIVPWNSSSRNEEKWIPIYLILKNFMFSLLLWNCTLLNILFLRIVFFSSPSRNKLIYLYKFIINFTRRLPFCNCTTLMQFRFEYLKKKTFSSSKAWFFLFVMTAANQETWEGPETFFLDFNGHLVITI